MVSYGNLPRNRVYTIAFGQVGWLRLVSDSRFIDILGNTLFTESLNLAFALIAFLILRRFDGMLEDQKIYLKRVAREREDARIPKEEVWAGYTELDEEELKSLHGDKAKEGDGIDLRDEYPPESAERHINGAILRQTTFSIGSFTISKLPSENNVFLVLLVSLPFKQHRKLVFMQF